MPRIVRMRYDGPMRMHMSDMAEDALVHLMDEYVQGSGRFPLSDGAYGLMRFEHSPQESFHEPYRLWLEPGL